jgi:DNA-binding beta-propeller fold protein YncE
MMPGRISRRRRSLWRLLPAAAVVLLAGCSPPPGPAAVIRYRQIGACNAEAGANSNAAFVLFQIVGVSNGSSTQFAFDPTKLYVVTGSGQPHLSTTAPILSSLNAMPASAKTVAGGQEADFPPASFGVVTVTTSATGANQARFFLNYAAGSNDPPVLFESLNLSRTMWPDNQNCSDMTPILSLGQYAYADQAGEISTFKIDPATGALSDLDKPVADTFLSGDQDPGVFAVNPNGRFLYAIDSTHNEILIYKIDADGALDPGEMIAAGATVDPFGLVIDPSGQFLYAETIVGVDAFVIQPSGQLVSAGHIDADGIEAIAIDGSGSFLYVLSAPFTGETLTVFAINRNTGALSPVKNLSPVPIEALGGLDFMTRDPASGVLYVGDQTAKTVRTFKFQFDPANPTLKELPSTPAPNGLLGLTVEPAGGFLYLLTGSDAVSLFGVSATGALTPLPTPTTLSPVSIVAEPTGRFLYMRSLPAQTLNGYKLSSSDGSLTSLPGAPLIVKGNPTIPGTY